MISKSTHLDVVAIIFAAMLLITTTALAQGNDAAQCVYMRPSDGVTRFYNHCSFDINITLSTDRDSKVWGPELLHPNQNDDPAGDKIPFSTDGPTSFKWAACAAPQVPSSGADNHKPTYDNPNYHCQ